MIVVAASAALRAPPHAGRKSSGKKLFDREQMLHAPHLLDVEVAQVIRRYAVNGEIDDDCGRSALADLADFPLHRYPHDLLLPRVWESRNNLTAYGTVYVALAEALDAPLLTRYRRLAAVAGHQLIPDHLEL